MKPTVSCNKCGYVTFMPCPIEAEDWMQCPECDGKQRAEDCTQCKVACPGDKPFVVTPVGVNANFNESVLALNRQFKILLKSYNDTQNVIAETNDAIGIVAKDLYRKCSSEISRAIFVANNIDINDVSVFMMEPYITVTSVPRAAVHWLDTPHVIAVPGFVNLHIGIPLGRASGGSRYYLVSSFTLIQYGVPGEIIESIGLSIPLDISVNCLHVSGPDMDEFEDTVASIELARRDDSDIPGSSGISPLSAATYGGGAMNGSNFRTAEITNPMIAIPALGSMGISVNNKVRATGKLTALTELLSDDPENGSTVEVWVRDVLLNSNCHLVGGSRDDLAIFVAAVGSCLIRSVGHHAASRRATKVIYIGDLSENDRQWTDHHVMMVRDVNLLDQDDYDDADMIVVDGENWINNPKMTNSIVPYLASTRTPVCVWTRNPEADLFNVMPSEHADINSIMAGTILRYISSLCPCVSGDLVSAAERPLALECRLESVRS